MWLVIIIIIAVVIWAYSSSKKAEREREERTTPTHTTNFGGSRLIFLSMVTNILLMYIIMQMRN